VALFGIDDFLGFLLSIWESKIENHFGEGKEKISNRICLENG
jgi:hypothetical protein